MTLSLYIWIALVTVVPAAAALFGAWAGAGFPLPSKKADEVWEWNCICGVSLPDYSVRFCYDCAMEFYGFK